MRLSMPRPREFPRGYPQRRASLGAHIRRQRLDLGLPQRILAERWRVTRATVAGWELGRCQPSIRHWPLVVDFLGCCDPTGTTASLGERLRALRRRHGWTQSELAAQAGLDEGTVIDLEAGRRNASARVIAIVGSLFAQR